MTDAQAREWEKWRVRGQPLYRLFQAMRCFGLMLMGCSTLALIQHTRLDFRALLPMFGLLSFIWYFFAIGLWHKNEYAYLQHADSGKSLSPGLSRG